MTELYAWGTTNGLRATLALAECGLAHRLIPVDLSKKENRAPAYLALNPGGQIPTLVDPDGPGGRLVLGQSGAIVLYACNKAGRHIPAGQADYLEALKWFMQAASDIGGTSSALQQVAVVAAEKVPSNIQIFEQRLLRYFSLVNDHLAGRDFLAGAYSFADIMMYPNYVLRRGLLDSLGDLPQLRAWAARIAARPATAEGMRLMA